MECHPIAESLPLMTDAEYADLKDSIAKHGVLVPLWRYEGKILDGRHRYRACVELGVPCLTFRDFEGTPEQALLMVEALNLDRRNLSPDQKREARARIVREMRDQGMSTRAIADAVGVSHETVRKDLACQVSTRLTPAPEPELDSASDPAPEPVRPAPPADPPKVTGKDGKQYAAKRPQKKPSDVAAVESCREPDPDNNPEDRMVRGKGIELANDAINCLIRIPKNDALRSRGLQLVTDWIERNRLGTLAKSCTVGNPSRGDVGSARHRAEEVVAELKRIERAKPAERDEKLKQVIRRIEALLASLKQM